MQSNLQTRILRGCAYKRVWRRFIRDSRKPSPLSSAWSFVLLPGFYEQKWEPFDSKFHEAGTKICTTPGSASPVLAWMAPD